MVLPEKLLGIGIGLGSLLSPVDAAAASHRVLKLRDLGGLAGSSTTDLVRFSGTLKVARGIVEEHKRSDIIEVPTSGLVSILDRIKALEKEVQDLLDGKKVNKDSKAIEPSASDSASVGSASSSPDASSSAGPLSGGSNSDSSAKDPSTGSGSTGSGSTQSGSTSSGSSPSATASDTGSSAGSSNGEDDCAPEHLLYRLGGGSLQRRSMTVSDHPLFRRSTNCTLDSVSGGKKEKQLPSGAAVFKEGSVSVGTDSASPTSAAGGTESIGGTTDSSSAANSAAEKAVALESQFATPSSASADEGAVKLDGHTLSVTSLPAATTAGLGSKVKGSPSESDDETTTTTTMTSTSYSTITVHVRPTATKAGSNGKFLNNTAIPERVTSAGHLLQNGTAIPTGPGTTSLSAALAGQGGLVQDDDTSRSLPGAPIFQKNATAPTSSESSSGSSESSSMSSSSSASSSSTTRSSNTTVSSSSSSTTNQSSSSSTAQVKTITPTATRISLSDPDSITILPQNQKNITFPSATSSTPSSAISSTASSATSSSTVTSSSAKSATSASSQPLLEKNITAPTSQTMTSSPFTTALSTDKQSSSAPQSMSSSAAALGEKVAVSEPSKRTSTTTSTVSITVPAAGGDTAISTTSSTGGVSGGAATEPEATTATTSALVSRPAFFNGTLDKRQSGFRTVRTLRGRTAVADEQC
ncbi:uncharacterized protein LMH87_007826 [Akanthomyces muscarius]|uniref:Uncharacterized protein n=1 Tax=Akanthomyces muscarius TaxID=2231603 RepID=A0A9W8QJM2_AKAMU|nr:uncharacterized protein LMH87_007826 [Akanthomyces muscarius]KAJ4159889.1 hypothetical protein LMH87_007826 [Akanthomyces muscarius]